MDWGKQFCGITMSSNYQTFDLISRVLDTNLQIRRIVEIGTYTGSLSIYLGLEALSINSQMPMYTFNIERQHSAITESIFKSVRVEFVMLDVFERRKELFHLFDRPTFLLCDGGNKYEEYMMCVPQLPSGSIVAVHDYSTEFTDEHWKKLADKVEPVWQDEWLKEDVRLAIFRIK